MVKIDLITGFLGSGKTTFIRKYVEYLIHTGEKVCILENDYGAINVDMMLLSDLKCDQLGLEMVAGGCDYDCHMRRFKTKLITMAMLGYNRVIVEPSGIFDVDEFYDILHEDPLYNRYTISNVLAIVDANLEETMSKDCDYLLASQIATAGRIILSHVQEVDDLTIQKTIHHIQHALEDINCKRVFDEKNITMQDWNTLNEQDFNIISNSGYQECGYVKKFNMNDNRFESLFFMNIQDKKATLLENISMLWKDTEVGHIIRIKGFIEEDGIWYEINSTVNCTNIKTIEKGQTIIIVIGEGLHRDRIDAYFNSEYSTIRTQ